jgi:hypothetical protein
MKTFVIAAFVLIVPLLGFAKDLPEKYVLKPDAPEKVKLLWEACKQERKEQYALLKSGVKKMEQNYRHASDGRIEPNIRGISYSPSSGKYLFPSQKVKDDELASLMKSGKALVARFERLKSGDEIVYPYIADYSDKDSFNGKMKVGNIGRSGIVRIENVVNGTTLIVKISGITYVPNRTVGGSYTVYYLDDVVWFSGFDTAGLVDNSVLESPPLFEVVGTHTYATAIGSQKTIFEIKPFDIMPYLVEVGARKD